MKDMITGAFGNCQVCGDEMKDQDSALISDSLSISSFWVCLSCLEAYNSLRKRAEKSGTEVPIGKNFKKSILEQKEYLEREYLEGVKFFNEAAELVNIGRNEEALKMLMKAIKVFRDIDALEAYQAALGNAAMLYTDFGRYEEALKSHIEEEKICIQLGLESNLGVSLYNQGRLYYKMGKLSRAGELLQRSVQLLIRSEEYEDVLKKAEDLLARLV